MAVIYHKKLAAEWTKNITIKESRPSTTARELGVALVEGCPTASTGVDALSFVVIVFTSPCRFCPFLT